MPRLKLTSAAVEKLKNEEGRKRQEYFDSLIPGLALRISRAGNKSWNLFHRKNGKLQRHTIGKYPLIDLALARESARQFLLSNTPYAVAAPFIGSAESVNTLSVVVDEFIEKYAKPRNRSWEDTERLFNNRLIPAWGNRTIDSITKPEVVKLFDSLISEGVPTLANRLFAHARKLFNWAVERGYIAQSPMQNLKAPAKENSRDRVLNDEELKKIWLAATHLSDQACAYIHLLALLGQRRGEVAAMEWAEINDGIWSLPSTKTKNGCGHDVPLPPQALAIINRMPKRGAYVFTNDGENHLSGFSKLKVQLDKLSGVSNWTLHDFRRTCATGMAKLGTSPHVIEAVLNHKSGTIKGVSATYNRHTYIIERRAALEQWATYLQSLSSK